MDKAEFLSSSVRGNLAIVGASGYIGSRVGCGVRVEIKDRCHTKVLVDSESV